MVCAWIHTFTGVCLHVCVCVVWATIVGVWEDAKTGGAHTPMHACMHPCRDPLHFSALLPPLLSIYHASIGLSASGMRWGERGRGEGYMGRKRNKFSTPTLKMHIHFHTLKRQWGAHTLTGLSQICTLQPHHRHTHTQTHTKKLNTAKMNVCVLFSGCGWKSSPCHIYLHKSRRWLCVSVHILVVRLESHCVCFWVSVYISWFTSTHQKRPYHYCRKKHQKQSSIGFADFLV